MKQRCGYRPEIDGLRAVAVIPVIFFHAGFRIFSGGFVGVDVFFTISGYLITSIIVMQLEAGTFTFTGFYERRARRILPALFTVLLCCIPFAWLWMLPFELKGFATSIIAVCLFASNILLWRESGYFDTISELKPLLHTWSLAVEEQFYIFFPIILLVLWRYWRKTLIPIIVLVAIVSFILSEYASRHYPSFDFYWAPTRAWELLAGSLCNFVTIKSKYRIDNILSLIGLISIAFSIFFFDSSTPFPSIYALIPVLGTCLVLLFGVKGTYVGNVLSIWPAVTIGLISYSAYLWHQPLFAFVREWNLYPPSKLTMFSLSASSIVLGFLSWRFVELPWRRQIHSNWTSTKFLVIWLSTFAVSLILFGLGGRLTDGYARIRFGAPTDERLLAELTIPTNTNGWCFYNFGSNLDPPIASDGAQCTILSNKFATKQALLFGDSFAGHYGPFFRIIGGAIGRIDIKSIATSWCYPTITSEFTGPSDSRAVAQCAFNRKYLVDNAAMFDVIVLAGHWGQVLEQGKLHGTLDLISYLSSRTKLVIVMASPKLYDFNVSRVYLMLRLRGIPMKLDDTRQEKDAPATAANEILSNYARRYTNVLFIDRQSMFSINGAISDTSADGVPFSQEGIHLSIHGSKQAAFIFEKSVAMSNLLHGISTLGQRHDDD
jgi:peptidoglycan/LPS O-acetylase OafA/YrhL